jgi:endonuclease/exonuclease/phosphatase family metal-dependent hydrolase
VLANIESFFHRLRRRFSRTERAIQRRGLGVSEQTGEQPGLLLIEIDGLSRRELESAIESGKSPYLRRIQVQEGYRLHSFHSGKPTSKALIQSELYYGACDVSEIVSPAVESKGLLAGGSSWANALEGGATAEECHFCQANPPSPHDRHTSSGTPAGLTSIRFLELLTEGAKMDIARGLPIVHVSLNVLDEPSSDSARSSLRAVDDSTRALIQAAHRSQRRDYHVWIFSIPPAARSEGAEGFLLVPPATWLSSSPEDFVRPSDLRGAAMILLHRAPSQRETKAVHTPPDRLTVMSYNTHSCIGMDGRVSPRRIARVIARQGADLVALQELDHGRARSRAEDQAGDIAAELGFHLLFCPAVVKGDERYGHALLSRWPLEAVKIAPLPFVPGGIWPEPRGAIWARTHIGDIPLNILSTHLGLSASERMKQMAAILGEEWLGPVLDHELVVLCGDFNLTPGSAAHRLAATRLRDVAHGFKRGVRTFSSMRLVAQLDHIFVSPHFGLEAVFAAQNDLTRVASDHLPLVASLRLPGR